MVSYPDAYNPDLLERIPLSARTVLDVGCGTAALGAAYRRRNPRARLLGIDRDPGLRPLAAPRLDELATLDVEDDPLPFDVPEGIDCIVYGDVLAQLREPWQVMRQQIEALSAGGMVLICVPNLEHWSFTERVLRGTWDYEDSGLQDRQHLRWFSMHNMRKNLVELGLALCDVHPRIFNPEQAHGFVQAMAPTLAALGIDREVYLRRAAPIQLVWRARKEPQTRLMIAANMLAPVGGVSDVRIAQPMQAMSTDPTVGTRVGSNVEVTRPGDDTPRIFVLHRPVLSGQQGRALIEGFLRSGWLVVTEFDDHPDFFQVMQDREQLTFRGVHAVQTSTPALAEVLRQRNPEVAIFPNAIASLPDPVNFADPGRLTVFFGALNREQDWEPIMPAINAVAAKAGSRLHFSVVHDRSFFDALQTPHKEFTPTCDYPAYFDRLSRCEISLMPLADNGFNRAKSDLKFIEAASCRVAPLASTVVYEASIQEGQTGLLFRDADELHARLLRLVAMPELAREIADAARKYVAEQRMLAYQVAPRIAWYRSLWARREALTAALRARLNAAPADLAPIV